MRGAYSRTCFVSIVVAGGKRIGIRTTRRMLQPEHEQYTDGERKERSASKVITDPD
jgi:hypothetical protein